MVPAKANPVWRFLVSGRIVVQSSSVAFNMMICTCKIRCRQDVSPAAVEELAEHAFQFFTKYEKLLQPELKQLTSSSPSPEGGRARAANHR